ncbi:MAG: thioredoxin family protein [Deltaproteobacteria bacterium]|nr:thioredoxin family protein [Deltaproteobacteria bacterium]
MLRRVRSRFVVLLVASGACVGSPYDADPSGPAPKAAPTPTPTPSGPHRPEFVRAAAGDAGVGPVVKAAQRDADAQGRRLVVYASAPWCEPCQVFHRAVEAGELDRELAGIRFLEFDVDVDSLLLSDAGYGGRLIPRFVLPDAEGHGTDDKIEGGVKGERAAQEIMTRLGPLLARR